MASQKQIDANRRNAQLSTGPKTFDGARSPSPRASPVATSSNGFGRSARPSGNG